MEPRLNYATASPEAMRAMMALEGAVRKLGIEQPLVELIKLRASQINGCAFCVDMHTTDARKAGETERRLHNVIVWRETPFFTPRERAALGWTEALTLISETHAPDQDYDELRAYFTEREMVNMTMVIAAINCWNRLAIGFRHLPQA